MMKVPLKPSTTAFAPLYSSSRATSVCTSAGIFMDLASIAVWELVEPCLVTMARILLLSICTVSLGDKSSASRTTGSSEAMPSSPTPARMRISLLEISSTSAERAFIYSSSMLAKIPAKFSPVRFTANSAFIFSSRIRPRMESR